MRETGAKCYIIVILTGLAFCLVSSVFDTFSMPRGVAEFRVLYVCTSTEALLHVSINRTLICPNVVY